MVSVGRSKKPDRKTTMRDVKLITTALKHADPGTARYEFVLRIRRSFRMNGTLTTAMREALQ
jgi:hypothetical protein